VRGNVLPDVLTIQGQHPDLAASQPQEVDDPEPTSLASAFRSPSEFPHSSGPWDNYPGVGMFVQMMLKLRVVIIVEVVRQGLREQRRLYEGE
jgi:hypothetical protein